MRKRYPTDLSDAEWNYIRPHLPAPTGHGRPRTHNLREILDAIFYLLKSGCQWRLLPHDFPRWPTVYWYFRKWRMDGTWERVNRALRERLRVRSKRDLQPSAGVVERTIAWIDQSRRMSKDYKRLCASGEAFVYAAMIRLMTRRLARV